MARQFLNLRIRAGERGIERVRYKKKKKKKKSERNNLT